RYVQLGLRRATAFDGTARARGGNCPAHPGVDVDFGSSAILVDAGKGRSGGGRWIVRSGRRYRQGGPESAARKAGLSSGAPRCTVAQMNPASAIPGAVFSGAMDGHLRAYKMDTGEVIWDFDAAREFPAVNGIPTHGGAFSATGATVVDGMLFVSSGYSGISGNALLAFSIAP
ncbi:MAG TPA: hypothetical protein VK604_24600, partial [Bryobacteraceae bacterium]|nr:hypothetical protein [Bryobacteraceae bacterium]